jgi:hypothetical protein
MSTRFYDTDLTDAAWAFSSASSAGHSQKISFAQGNKSGVCKVLHYYYGIELLHQSHGTRSTPENLAAYHVKKTGTAARKASSEMAHSGNNELGQKT